MNQKTHNAIVNFIWNIANDVLRDKIKRGKWADVILPFTVLRRLDALLVPTKDAVLADLQFLQENKIDSKESLTDITKYSFYNTSKFTFEKLLDDSSNIDDNLETYIDTYSENVREILTKFKIKNYLQTLEEAEITYLLIQKFASKDINLSPVEAVNAKGEVLPPLTNLGMGYVFEELIRRFNEENNEEAGQHFTPREVIRLMTNILFLPVKDKITLGGYSIYDPACGSGGMLTEGEQFAKAIAGDKVRLELFGQESEGEIYAICRADMLIKGKQEQNIFYGSTLSKDGFPSRQFDFMLSNPPYGKTWKLDQDAIIDDKKVIKDRRFSVGVPRISDGQLLFLVNMISKMKHDTKLGSRIATVHNGSALFTGDAGSGESEIRKWIITNDWLECIIQLPNNMFYNTGIATYIWILSNRKPANRKGKIQLIDASNIYDKMRKSLGNKSNEFSKTHIKQITQMYLDFEETGNSKIFDNSDFGYTKVTVERPLRLAFQFSNELWEKHIKNLPPQYADKMKPVFDGLQKKFSANKQLDYNGLESEIDKILRDSELKLVNKERKEFLSAFSWKDETAKEVIKKKDKKTVVYEADNELKDTENVPLKEDVDAYFKREVVPFAPDAWLDRTKDQIGYEISFTKIFFKHTPLRSLDDISRDIIALEAETDGILKKIVHQEAPLSIEAAV